MVNVFHRWVVTALFLAGCVFSSAPEANERNVYHDYQLVNKALSLYSQNKSFSSPDDALRAYHAGSFLSNTNNTVSLGFTNKDVWAALPIIADSAGITQIITIDNAWLDEVDIHIFHNEQLQRSISLGDKTAFSTHKRNTRMPSVEHVLPKGITVVLFRFKSKDPMTFPIYVGSEEAVKAKSLEHAYFYGALYGSLLILFLYNVVLFISLKERRYLYYSLYLLAFTLFNFVYTGHGYWLLWPSSVFLQQWLMPTLMFCYLMLATTFTISFLNAKAFLPKLYSRRKFIYAGLISLAIVIMLSGDQTFAIMSQLIVLTTLSIWMLLIGFAALRKGNPIAKFFLPAIAMGTGGATVSSLATWGIIPYSQWAFRGIEIGMLCEMSLLSISLGTSFKLVEEARKSAESIARLDPLTNLYNRRAYTDLIGPIWAMAKRKNERVSVVLVDLDWFKKINDEFGHSVGDDVLETIATEIKTRIRASDIAIRWGGEEFLLFLPNTDAVKARTFAEVLRKCIENAACDENVKVTASIGVASASPVDIGIDSLISLADEALYEAKAMGRNQVAYKDVPDATSRAGLIKP